MHVQAPLLILIRGLPGSGKSSLAAALQQKIGVDTVVTLDPDATDYNSPDYLAHSAALASEGVEPKFFPYRYLRSTAHKAILDQKIIIWNQAFTLLHGFRRTVDNLQTFAREHDIELPVLIVEMAIPENVARQRVDVRTAEGGHAVPEATFKRFVDDYYSFADEGHPTVTIDGEGNLDTSAELVLQAIQNLTAS